MRALLPAATALLLFVAPPFSARPALAKRDSKIRSPESADTLLRKALRAEEQAQFDRALDLLRNAAQRTTEPELLARIELRLGIIYAIMEDEEQARASFRQALTHHLDITIDPTGLKPSIVALFRAVRQQLRGEILVTADQPGAAVFVDGRGVGRTPLQLSLPAGAHQVEVRGSGGAVGYTKRIVLGIDQRLSIVASLGVVRPSKMPRRRVWTWIAAAGSALTLIVGIGLGGSARAEYSEYQDPATGRSRGEELASSIEAKSTAANVMFGVSGALAITSVVLFFMEGRPSREMRSAQRILPLVGRGCSTCLSMRF